MVKRRWLLALAIGFPALLGCAGMRGPEAQRGADAPTCEFLPEEDRGTDPFTQPQAIAGVVPFGRSHFRSAAEASPPAGATVLFRPARGLTTERLQALVDCTLARHAFLHPGDPRSPLSLRGVRARAASAGNGFAVILESDDPEVAQEIIRRASALEAAERK